MSNQQLYPAVGIPGLPALINLVILLVFGFPLDSRIERLDNKTDRLLGELSSRSTQCAMSLVPKSKAVSVTCASFTPHIASTTCALKHWNAKSTSPDQERCDTLDLNRVIGKVSPCKQFYNQI